MKKDKTTLKRIETAHPDVREELHCIYNEICKRVNSEFCQVRFSDVFRSLLKQDAKFAQGRTKPGAVVTWVRGGYSFHNYGLAIDIVLLLDRDKNGSFESASWDTKSDENENGVAEWNEVVSIFKSYGWQWGIITRSGKHIDKPHFQKTFGFKASELKELKKDANNYPILN